jgi:iron complex outermembrane receptor protein
MKIRGGARRIGVSVMASALVAGGLTVSSEEVRAQDVSVTETAQATTRSFNIPPQPLASALPLFGQQSGRQITSDGNAVQGATTSGVQGTMTVEEALRRLLAGTGMTYSVGAGAVISVQRVGPTGSNALTLDPVQVQGVLVPSQAQIGQPAKPYAGGQVDRNNRVGVLGNRDYMDTPFSISTYTEQTIQNQQATTLTDVLAVDPTIRPGYSQGTNDDRMFIRGFNVTPQDLGFNGLYGLFINSVGVAGIDRVEVFRGPTALLNGMTPRGAIGGTVNLVSKRAPDAGITEITARYASAGQVGGQADVGRRFGPDKELGIRINGAYLGGNSEVLNNPDGLLDLTLGMDFRSPDTRLAVDIGYLDRTLNGSRWGATIAAGIPVPAAPSSYGNFYQPASFSRQNNLFGMLQFEHDIAPNLMAYLKIGGQRSNSNNFVTNNTIVNTGGVLNSSMTRNIFFNETISADLGVRSKFETGPVKHELAINGTYLLNQFGFRNTAVGAAFASNIYTPTYNNFVIPAIADMAPATTSLNLTRSIGLVDAMSFWDDKIQLIGGVRYGRIEVSNYNGVTGQMTTATPGYDMGAVTPSVSLVLRPWHNIAFYGNYIEALEQGGVVAAPFANAGTIFAPYVSRQFEVGVKADFGVIGGSLSAFQITRPSVVTNVAANTQGVDGQQRNQGLEFLVFGEPLPGVKPLGGFTVLNGIQTATANGINNGKYAVGVPTFQANLGVDWATPFWKGFQIGGRVIYTGPTYADAANLQPVPAWTRFDMSAQYTFERADGKPISIRANIFNVGNANYWIMNQFLSNSNPRTFMLSLSAEF